MRILQFCSKRYTKSTAMILVQKAEQMTLEIVFTELLLLYRFVSWRRWSDVDWPRPIVNSSERRAQSVVWRRQVHESALIRRFIVDASLRRSVVAGVWPGQQRH